MTSRALCMCAVVAIATAASVAANQGSRLDTTLSVLESLVIDHAEIDWRACDERTRRVAEISLLGTVELPTGSDFHSLEPTALLNLHLGERVVINASLSYAPKGERSDQWISTGANAGEVFMEIVWESDTIGAYRMRGKFDPAAFALDGAQETSKLTFVLSLGDELLTQEASVYAERWQRIEERYWRTRKHAQGLRRKRECGQ